MGPAIRTSFQMFALVAVFCLFSTTGISLALRSEVRGAVGAAVELECGSPPDLVVSASQHVVEWVCQGVDTAVLIKFGAYAPRVHPKYDGRVTLVRNTTLQVTGLELDDHGLYECRIFLLDKSTYNSTWTLLTVTAPPTFTKTPPPVMEALVGSRLTFACAARGNPTPTVSWLKDGVLLGENAEVHDGTLSVRALGMESGGQYACRASNSQGNVTHVTKLKVKGPPVIVIPPKSTSLNMSQNALLRCQAVADPPNMTYVWLRGGVNVHHIETLKSRVKIMVDGTLLISSLVPEDSGNFTCMPTNGLLTPPTASARLTVMHPAQALQMPKETYLPTAMEGLVSCPVLAQPPLLRVTWTKDGEPLNLSVYPGWSMTSEGSVFMATVNDDAAGVYACTPYNSYGSMGPSEPTAVILQDPPSFGITPLKQYSMVAGRTLQVPCQGNGHAATSITWRKVGAAPRSAYSVADDGTLLLQPLSKDHQGAWECSATNHVASVEASTLILVLGTSPHAATSLSVSPGATQANISWEAGFDGGSAQTFSVWVKQLSVSAQGGGRGGEWFSVPVPPSTGTGLQVTGLHPATDYQFSVLSHNRVGTGPFSQIATLRTLDPPPQRSKLSPPTMLSANQGSAGVVLQWSPPAAQRPPITGFVLQSRTAEQGEWFDLDKDVAANSSEIIVPGLRKDCVYELRLLSRRGEMLSEPSPSVNVSTIGVEIYPATSRLRVPSSLLVGVMGGAGLLCLALILVLGSACLLSHKRGRRRRKENDDPPPVIFTCPPNMNTSRPGSPDSMLKQNLLHPHNNLYPTTSSTSSTTTSSSCSSAGHSSVIKGDHIVEYQGQGRQLLMSAAPRDFPSDGGHQPQRVLRLKRASSSPISPPLEFISRGPDGRFVVQPYDRMSSTLNTYTRRGLRKDYSRHPGAQRSMSLYSQRGDGKEPPFVLSVDLPPCGPASGSRDSPARSRVRDMAKYLSLHHDRYMLEDEGDYKGYPAPDQDSLYSDSTTQSSAAGFPLHPDREVCPTAYPVLKGVVVGQPSTTASNLVLQMEHERERGNLSRCLKLAQEREELEMELRKYTVERSERGGEERGTATEAPGGRDVEEGRRESGELVWKYKGNTFPHSHPQRSRGSRALSTGTSHSPCIQWEDPALQGPLHRPMSVSPLCYDSISQYSDPSFTKQTSHKSEEAGRQSSQRLVLPHLSSKHQRHHGRVQAEPEGYGGGYDDNSPQSTDLVEMQRRNDSCSGASWKQSNLSRDSRSSPSHSCGEKYNEMCNFPITAVMPGPSKAEMAVPKMCVEMSVDEPELVGSVMSHTKPPNHQIVARCLQDDSLTQRGLYEEIIKTSFTRQSPTPTPGEQLQRRCARPNRTQSSLSPPGPHLWKPVSRGGSQKMDYYHQRSKSLDSKRQSRKNFLTPNAWIDSLSSQENCSTSFSSDSVASWAPRSTPSLETPKPGANASPRSAVPPSHSLLEPPSASPPVPSSEPLSLRGCSTKPNPSPAAPSSGHPPRRDPDRQTSNFADASRWSLIPYEEKQSPRDPAGMAHTDSRLPESSGGPLQEASMYDEGFSWPSPGPVDSPPLPRAGIKVREGEKEAEVGGQEEVEVGSYGRVPESRGGYSGYGRAPESGGGYSSYGRAPESGGSYSSYASSGRGSLEPTNGRLSLCLSPTHTISPETVEERQEDTTEDKIHDHRDPSKRRPSVDENYEWDTEVDVSLDPGGLDDEERGVQPSSAQLQKAASMHFSSSSQGNGQAYFYTRPETEPVLF